MLWGIEADEWTALGTWVYAALTALVVWVAWRQLRSLVKAQRLAELASEAETRAIRDQIEVQREIADRQLRFSLRPRVAVESGFYARNGGSSDFTVRNVGSGPALEVELLVWFVTMQDGRDPAQNKAAQEELRRTRADPTKEFFQFNVGGLAPGQAVSRDAEPTVSPTGWLMGLAHVSYKDVFEEVFRGDIIFGIRPQTG